MVLSLELLEIHKIECANRNLGGRGKDSSNVMGIGFSRTQQEADKYDAEDLHVYIEADNEKAAVEMFEKPRIPYSEEVSEQKLAKQKCRSLSNLMVKVKMLAQLCAK